MIRVPLQFVDAFTATPGCGNRAGVVLDAGQLTAAQMQAVAAGAGVAETAFGIPTVRPAEYDVEVRYFSRTREVPFCGHATLAFHYLRARTLGFPSQVVRARTGAGILPATVERDGNDVRVVLTLAAPRVLATPDAALRGCCLDALGLAAGDVAAGLPVQVVSTGHAKVLIPIRSHARLNALRPNRGRLLDLSPLAGADGFFVFTLDRPRAGVLYHGRMFAPATGVDEDPATGNANGAAGCYLFAHGRLHAPEGGMIRYRAAQGEAMGRPGRVEVLLHVGGGGVERVQVSGRAVLVTPGAGAGRRGENLLREIKR
jgi:PhzF family phenazine biosynthesis protein